MGKANAVAFKQTTFFFVMSVMQKTLMSLGFTEIDTQVYLFLLTEGPEKAREIAEALNLYNQQLFPVLKKFQNRGLVNASHDFPAFFSAVLFEKVLDYIVKAKKEQHKTLQESREALLSVWSSTIKKDSEDNC
jgi:sugar-specific transcriptional regulator TrmB